MGAERGIPCSSLKTAAVVVAIVEVLLLILAVWGLCYNLALFGAPYLIWFIVGVISSFIILLAIFLMLYAIKKDKPRWLIPHLSAQLFLIIFLIVVAFVVALLLLFAAYRGIRNLFGVINYHMSDESTALFGLMIIVVYLLVAALECFFLFIVWKLYKHMTSYRKMQEGAAWQGALPKDAYHGSPNMGDQYPYGQDRAAAAEQRDAYDPSYGNQAFDQQRYGQGAGFQNQQQTAPLRGYDRQNY